MWILCVASFAILAVPVLAQDRCAGLPNGSIIGTGCQSYTNCTNGVGRVVDCPVGFAFDSRTERCEPWASVPPPCGSIDNDCTGLDDGLYPIFGLENIPDCMYYYTCSRQAFFGTKPCNPGLDTGDLRFDLEDQSCNWFWAVLPPCGTYVPTEAPPSETTQGV
jgi:hypothetical protein